LTTERCKFLTTIHIRLYVYTLKKCIHAYIYVNTYKNTYTHTHTLTHTLCVFGNPLWSFFTTCGIFSFKMYRCGKKKWAPIFTDSNVQVYYINYCNSHPYSLAKSCAVFAFPTISFVHFLTFHKYFISAASAILTRSTVHASISSKTGNDYTLRNITVLSDIPLFRIVTLKQNSRTHC
jgi:hypothetical protein